MTVDLSDILEAYNADGAQVLANSNIARLQTFVVGDLITGETETIQDGQRLVWIRRGGDNPGAAFPAVPFGVKPEDLTFNQSVLVKKDGNRFVIYNKSPDTVDYQGEVANSPQQPIYRNQFLPGLFYPKPTKNPFVLNVGGMVYVRGNLAFRVPDLVTIDFANGRPVGFARSYKIELDPYTSTLYYTLGDLFAVGKSLRKAYIEGLLDRQQSPGRVLLGWLRVYDGQTEIDISNDTFPAHYWQGEAWGVPSPIANTYIVPKDMTQVHAGDLNVTGNLIERGNLAVLDSNIVSERLLPLTDDQGNILLRNRAASKYYDGTNGSFIAFKAPANASGETLTWPPGDGDPNFVLTTNGSGVLSWTQVGAPGLLPDPDGATLKFDSSIDDWRAVTLLLMPADGNAYIGDGAVSDYTKWDNNGRLTLHGNARVYRHMAKDMETVGAGAAVPTKSTIGLYTVYNYNQVGPTQSLRMQFTLPPEWVIGSDIIVEVRWQPAVAAVANVKWDIDHKCTSPNDNVSLAGVDGTITTTQATGGVIQFLQTSQMTISGLNCKPDDELAMEITRDNTVVDNLGGNAALVDVDIRLLVDRLGQHL